MKKDTRHPYTYAADFVRSACRDGEIIPNTTVRSVSMSRATASSVIELIAAELGMTHEELAIKLSEAYQRTN